MKKIKLVFIIPSLRIGGTQRFISNLINNIDKNLFSINLIVLDFSNAIEIEPSDIVIHNLKIKRTRWSIIKIYKTLKKLEPDIVFTLQSHLSIYISFFRFLFSNKLKFIARESNIVSLKNNDYRYPKIQNFIYKIFMRKYDLIICQSQDMLEDLKNNFGFVTEKLKKINNLVDFHYVEKKSLEYKVEENYDCIICAASLSKQKGIDRLISSINLIKHKKVRVVIMGQGKSRKFYEKKIKEMNLVKNIKFIDPKKNPYPWIRKAKIYLLTSYFEGFPNVLLESGVLKKPSVVFKIKGGINEIIIHKKNGFIAENNNIKEYSKFIIEAINSKIIKKNIYKSVFKKFSPEKIVPMYEKTFINIMQNKININHN